jgi:hypothetical protein
MKGISLNKLGFESTAIKGKIDATPTFGIISNIIKNPLLIIIINLIIIVF